MTDRINTTKPNETTSIDDILQTISMAPDNHPNIQQPNLTKRNLFGGEAYYGPFTRARAHSDETTSSGIVLPHRFRSHIREEPYPSILQTKHISHESTRPLRSTPVNRPVATGDIQNYVSNAEPLYDISVSNQDIDPNVSINTESTIPQASASPQSNVSQTMDIDSSENGPTHYKDILSIANGLKLIELPSYLSRPLMILAKKQATATCKLKNSTEELNSAAFGIKTAELTFKTPPKFALNCASEQIILLRANYISNLRFEAQIKIDKLQEEVNRLQSLEAIYDPGLTIIHNNNDENWTWEALRYFVDQQSSIIVSQYNQKRKRDKETKDRSDSRFAAKSAEQRIEKTPESRTQKLEKAVLTLQRKLKNMKIAPTPSKTAKTSKKVNERKLKDQKTKNSKVLSKEKVPKKTTKKSTGDKKKGKSTGQKQTEKITIAKRKKKENL